MADLTDKEAAQTIKITGTNSLGQETNYVEATDNNELLTCDILNDTVTQGILAVATNTPVEVKFGTSPLLNRKTVLLQAKGMNITFGFSSGSQPFSLISGALTEIDVGENISIWVNKTSGVGTTDVAYAEFA